MLNRTFSLSKLIKPIVFSSILLSSGAALAEKPDFPTINLPEAANGQRAVELLGDQLPAIAAWYRMTPAQFSIMLRTDRSAWLDKNGRLFYVDQEASNQEANVATANAPYPYADTFKLHSKPGSNRVIYLDFTGYTISGNAWAGGATVVSPAYTQDADTSTFTNAEMDAIQEVWQRVAEDFAPFDVDVTTEDPGEDAINRTSSSDQNYGTRALITAHDSRLCGSCGGVAYVGVFDLVGGAYYQPAYVFYDKLGSAKNIAEAASHEVGHNLGLSHDGTSSTGYYGGHGSGATSWSPLMGVGYYTQLSQWSKGEYADANNSQDDFVIMQSNGALLATDDHADTLDASATSLSISAGQTAGTSSVSGAGIISEQTDKDVFKFTSGAGTIDISVDSPTTGTNLDIVANLYDGAGNLIASSNPIEATNASINIAGQAADTYYLEIDGTGKEDPYVDGYTDYGSLGQYEISGTIPETSNLQAPTAVISNDITSGNAPLTVSFDASGSSDADGNIVAYAWDFDDGANDNQPISSHTFNVPGSYTVSLTVTDNDGLTGNDSTSINVNNQSPVAVASASPETGDAPLTVSFTGSGSYDPDPTHSVTYQWNFGDGGSSTSADPSYEYTASGNYTATLTVTDDLGATDSASISIVVNQSPDNNPPAAPSSLSLSGEVVSGRGRNQVIAYTLDWTDNADNEDYFIIERCQVFGRGQRTSCVYDSSLDIQVGADTTSYELGTVSSSFRYRVKAVNTYGESSPSNEVGI